MSNGTTNLSAAQQNRRSEASRLWDTSYNYLFNSDRDIKRLGRTRSATQATLSTKKRLPRSKQQSKKPGKTRAATRQRRTGSTVKGQKRHYTNKTDTDLSQHKKNPAQPLERRSKRMARPNRFLFANCYYGTDLDALQPGSSPPRELLTPVNRRTLDPREVSISPVRKNDLRLKFPVTGQRKRKPGRNLSSNSALAFRKRLKMGINDVRNVKAVKETFSFINRFDTDSVWLSCSEFTPLMISSPHARRRNGSEVKVSRFPSKNASKKVAVSYSDLSEAVKLFNELVKHKCTSEKSGESDKTAKYAKLSESMGEVKSLYSALVAFLSADDVPDQVMIILHYRFAWHIGHKKLLLDFDEKEPEIVTFKAGLLLSAELAVENQGTYSKSLRQSSSSRKNLSSGVSLSSSFMSHLPLNQRESALNCLFTVSVLLENYIYSSLNNYPEFLARARAEGSTSPVDEIEIIDLTVPQQGRFRYKRLFGGNMKSFAIPTRAQVPTARMNAIIAEQRAKVISTQSENKRRISDTVIVPVPLDENFFSQSKDSSLNPKQRRPDLLSNEYSLHSRLSSTEPARRLSCSDYFDDHNCALPFVKAVLDGRIMQPSFRCIDLKSVCGRNDVKLSFNPSKSTARVSLIEHTRMQQLGVRLGLYPLSPLLLRIEPREFAISPKDLKYLDTIAHEILFFQKKAAISLKATSAAREKDGETVCHKRWTNCWKTYLDSEAAELSVKKTETALEGVLDDMVDKLSFPDSFEEFTERLNMFHIKSLEEILETISSSGSFVCLHFDLHASEENKSFSLSPTVLEARKKYTDSGLRKLRTCDVKLVFYVKRVRCHDHKSGDAFMKRAFERFVRDLSGSSGCKATLFNRFYKEYVKLWRSNDAVRFDLVVSKNVWTDVVSSKPWLKEQLQVLVSVLEAHLKRLFRKRSFDYFMKKIGQRTYTAPLKRNQFREQSNKAISLFQASEVKFSRLSEHALSTQRVLQEIRLGASNVRSDHNTPLCAEVASCFAESSHGAMLDAFKALENQRKVVYRASENVNKTVVDQVADMMVEAICVSRTVSLYGVDGLIKSDEPEDVIDLVRESTSLLKTSNYHRDISQDYSLFVRNFQERTERLERPRNNFALEVYHSLWNFSASNKFDKSCIFRFLDSLGHRERSQTLQAFVRGSYLDKVENHCPLVFTDTRDSFYYKTMAFSVESQKLLSEEELRHALKAACSEDGPPGPEGLKTIDWCFDPSFGLPSDYQPRTCDIINVNGQKLFKVGVRTFLGVFNHHELCEIEDKTDYLYKLSQNARNYRDNVTQPVAENLTEELEANPNGPKHMNESTAQHTFTRGKCTRTKMFFNYRYLWTRDELKRPGSEIAHGIRGDPSPIPKWMRTVVERKLTERGIIKPRFESMDPVALKLSEMTSELENREVRSKNGTTPIEMNVNSFAVNIYHDGSTGLSQHFDDNKRFRANIVSMRLYSDSRLSFGCFAFGCSNGTFTVDMPRGSLQILDNDSYAGNKVKHCIKPGDMMGKSGVLLLREITENCTKDANKLLVLDVANEFRKMKL